MKAALSFTMAVARRPDTGDLMSDSPAPGGAFMVIDLGLDNAYYSGVLPCCVSRSLRAWDRSEEVKIEAGRSMLLPKTKRRVACAGIYTGRVVRAHSAGGVGCMRAEVLLSGKFCAEAPLRLRRPMGSGWGR